MRSARPTRAIFYSEGLKLSDLAKDLPVQAVIYNRYSGVFYLPYVEYYPDGQVEMHFGDSFDKISSDDCVMICSPTSPSDLSCILQYRNMEMVLLYHYGSRSDKRKFDVASVLIDCCPKLKIFNPHCKVEECEVLRFDYENYIEDKISLIIYPDQSAESRVSLTTNLTSIVMKKTRKDDYVVSEMPYRCNTQGEKVLVLDDLCDGGRTFYNVLEQCPDLASISLITPHFLDNINAEINLKNFSNIVTTNSYIWKKIYVHNKYRVIDCFDVPSIKKAIFG